jgi:beta-galactosidase/beta-glucuronidase
MKHLRQSQSLLTLILVAAGLGLPSTVLPARSLTSAVVPTRPPISLSIAGEWRFELDPDDRGVKERWFEELPSRLLRLPGSLQSQGYGNPVSVNTPWTGQIQDRSFFTDDRYAPYRQPGNIKLPFWLTPTSHYVGVAWYHREVLIPPDWDRKRVVLSLERCHWETALWINGQPVGSGDSLSTPHVYDVTRWMAPGRHRITLRVDNRIHIPVGLNSHSISDHTQGNWNGIVGALQLTASDPLYIEDIQVYPQLASRTARVILSLGNDTGRTLPANLYLRAASTNLATRHGAPLFEGRTDLNPGLSTV